MELQILPHGSAVIAELLQPTKIVFGLKGEFSQVIETLCKQSAISDLPGQLRNKKIQRDEERFSYIGDGIAIPHLRVDNLPAPELILGLSREGINIQQPCNQNRSFFGYAGRATGSTSATPTAGLFTFAGDP